MESWQFIQSPTGDWYWLCSNVISRQTRTSTATFKTRMECVANAMGSGYQKVAGGPSPQQQNVAAGRSAQQQNVAGAASGQPRHNRGPAAGAAQHKRPAPGGAPQPKAKRAQRRNRNKSGQHSRSN